MKPDSDSERRLENTCTARLSLRSLGRPGSTVHRRNQRPQQRFAWEHSSREAERKHRTDQQCIHICSMMPRSPEDVQCLLWLTYPINADTDLVRETYTIYVRLPC
jgi:hypothetical protein